MVDEVSDGLLGHAGAISSLGRAHTEVAARHRQAAAALRTGKRSLSFNSHFKGWLLDMTVLSEAAEKLLIEEVDLARRFGVSWADIGTAFGISRQAAWERFARKERADRAQLLLRATKADRANRERENELRRRKIKLIRELTTGEVTEHEIAALERALDITAALGRRSRS